MLTNMQLCSGSPARLTVSESTYGESDLPSSIYVQVSHSPYVNGVIDHLKPQHTVGATA